MTKGMEIKYLLWTGNFGNENDIGGIQASTECSPLEDERRRNHPTSI